MDYGEFTKEEVAHYRVSLRPLLYSGTLTGYNIYPNSPKVEDPFVVSYMHNGLGRDESKPRNVHGRRLLEKLESIGIGEIKPTVVTKGISRSAVYRYLEGWEDPIEDAEAFGENDEIVPIKDIRKYRGKIVLQAKEYELLIEADNEDSTKSVLEALKSFCHKYELNDDWSIRRVNGKKVFNNTADEWSWEVPPIIVSKTPQPLLNGFKKVSKLFLQKGKSEFSTLTKIDDILHQEIVSRLGFNLSKEFIFANRVSADHLEGIMA